MDLSRFFLDKIQHVFFSTHTHSHTLHTWTKAHTQTWTKAKCTSEYCANFAALIGASAKMSSPAQGTLLQQTIVGSSRDDMRIIFPAFAEFVPSCFEVLRRFVESLSSCLIRLIVDNKTRSAKSNIARTLFCRVKTGIPWKWYQWGPLDLIKTSLGLKIAEKQPLRWIRIINK